jgi:tetratricopeptide (TPR) repeat protein
MRRVIVGLAAVLVALAGCASKEKTSMKIYVQQKLYDKAIAQGSLALQTNPNDGDTHYFMGAAYYGKDLDLKPEDPTYAASSEDYLRKAFTHFEKAKELSPGAWGKSVDDNIVSMFGRHFNRGVIATKKNANAEAAVEYRLASIADPENYQGYYAHAAALLPLAGQAEKDDPAGSKEMYAAALKDLDKVIELKPPDKDKLVSTYQTKGEVLYRQGDAKGAQEAYAKAIELDPENYEMLRTMGQRFFNQGDYPSAADYLTQSLSIQERLNLIEADDAETYSIVGSVYSKQNQFDQALPAFQKALDLQPNSEEAMYNILVTHYKAGDAAEKAGQADDAKSHYNEGIKMCSKLIAVNANRPEYWQVCGYCKRGIGDTAGAARDLKRFNELKNAR